MNVLSPKPAPVKAPQGPFHVLLPGLSDEMWTPEQLLRFVALTVWDHEAELREQLDRMKEPYRFADFASALFWAGWAATNQTARPLLLPESGLAAWSEFRNDPAALLVRICGALYRTREFVFRVIEERFSRQPLAAAELAEVMVIAEKVTDEAGHWTELDNPEVSVAHPTKAQALAWSFRAKVLRGFLFDKASEWGRKAAQWHGDTALLKAGKAA